MQNHWTQGMHKMHKEHKNVEERRDQCCCGAMACMCEEGGGVQQLKWIEDKRCIEWEWRKKHNRQKNKKVQWMRAGRQGGRRSSEIL
jgi:hypothetical protein